MLQASERFEEDGRAEHAGTEGVYVLEGKVEVRLAERSIGLAAGDYLQRPSHICHQFRKASKEASVLVAVGRDRADLMRQTQGRTMPEQGRLQVDYYFRLPSDWAYPGGVRLEQMPRGIE